MLVYGDFNMLYSLGAFVAILVPLVVFHEFGHYIFAVLFGVKAEVFSIGFGPVLFRKMLGETEFRLSLIPLGGFVKLLGEDPSVPLEEQDLARSLHGQAPWKRFFIFFGGPLFNYILAFCVIAFILAVGEPHVAPVIARVLPGSDAALAGFQIHDRILAVDDQPVATFDDVLEKVHDARRQVLVKVQRGVMLHVIAIAPRIEEDTATLDGISPFARSLCAGSMGERITGVPASNWEELAALKPPFRLTIGSKVIDVQESLEKAGIFSCELFIDEVPADMPAAKAGLKHGDQIVKVGDQHVQTFEAVREQVQHEGKTRGTVRVTVLRQGKVLQFDIKPDKKVQYAIGIIPMQAYDDPEMVSRIIRNPITLCAATWHRTWALTVKNALMFPRMLTGRVPLGSIGGPLMIGKIAGESLHRGWMTFLHNMALFSIGLGVINLLPVPVLDGGHLLLLGIEVLRRKPLNEKQLQVAQIFGLMFVLGLMAIAFRNDIMRLFFS